MCSCKLPSDIQLRHFPFIGVKPIDPNLKTKLFDPNLNTNECNNDLKGVSREKVYHFIMDN